MALPGIDIDFQNGQLGQFLDLPDGVFGLLASAVAVGATFALNTPYQVRGMADVSTLGIISSVDNYVLHKTLREFYAEAGEGTELWIMGRAKTEKVSDWYTPGGAGKAPADNLLDAANGKISMLFNAFLPDGTYVLTVTTGLDADILAALPKAQTLADNYTNTKYAPLYVLFEGYGYDGNAATLKDLTTLAYNRCQVLIGNAAKRTGAPTLNGASVGILAGRLAKSSVQVNPGKVRDGALSNPKAYIIDTAVEQAQIITLHEKGYVTFRTHTGKPGYYFTDCPMACPASDDYHYSTHRRVIDKAYRLAYTALIDFVLDDNDVMPDGTISPIYAKTVEAAVIALIYGQMTVNGELSYDPTDPKDKGVICKVDLNNNVTSTGRLKLSQLQVRAKGYNRFIEVPLGFVPVTTS